MQGEKFDYLLDMNNVCPVVNEGEVYVPVLIEFLLKDNADTDSFATEYEKAELYSNGPAITKPLIRMINALSDGIMIGVLAGLLFANIAGELICGQILKSLGAYGFHFVIQFEQVLLIIKKYDKSTGDNICR